MLKLRNSDISSITSIDKANTFTWDELQTLLKDIVTRELPTTSSPVVFYMQDPGSEKNFSHSDHLATQELARLTSRFFDSNQCKQIAFEDYRTKDKTKNIKRETAGKKFVLFSAYDLIMVNSVGECMLCDPTHADWVVRSYHREFNCST